MTRRNYIVLIGFLALWPFSDWLIRRWHRRCLDRIARLERALAPRPNTLSEQVFGPGAVWQVTPRSSRQRLGPRGVPLRNDIQEAYERALGRSGVVVDHRGYAHTDYELAMRHRQARQLIAQQYQALIGYEHTKEN